MDDNEIMTEIRRSDVVCVLYDVNVEETFQSMQQKWLPMIRQAQQVPGGQAAVDQAHLIPVVLVGSKIDLREETPEGQPLSPESLHRSHVSVL